MSDFIPELKLFGPMVTTGNISILTNSVSLKTRPRINFVSGAGFDITATDDATNYKTDITIGGKAAGYYGSFCDTTTQSAAAANTAYAMTLNTTVEANGVSIVSGSKITVAYAGTYNLQFSAQTENQNTQIKDIDIWLSKNGTNVTNSNTHLSIPETHGGTHGHSVPAWNFVITLAANDYLQLNWSTTSTDVSLQYNAAQTSPTRPAIPSLIVTINQIANLA
jgi:hypothetical protein